jgi:hypothetical protein
LRIDTYKAEKRSLSTNELSRRLTALKQQGMVQMNLTLLCSYQANSVKQDCPYLNHALEGKPGIEKQSERREQ